MAKPKAKSFPQSIKQLYEENRSTVLVVLTALLLAVILLTVRAAGPLVSYEPETGSLGGNALIKSDNSVSGGKYVEFTAGTPPTPPPTGGDKIYLGPSTWPTSGWPARPSPTLRITNASTLKSQIANAPANAVIHIDINGEIKNVENIPVKAGQTIYGNGPQTTIFHGENKLNTLISINVNNLKLYDFGYKRYIGFKASNSQAPVQGNGGNSARIDNVYAWENHFSGLRLMGNDWHVTRFRGWDNGQFGFSGSPKNATVEYWETFRNGNSSLPSGVPRYSKTDRGSGKYSFTDGVVIRYGWAHDHDDKGPWYDIANKNFNFSYIRSENNGRVGLVVEASFGPGRLHHNEVWNNGPKNTNWQEDWMNINGQILVSTTGGVEVDNNDFRGRYGVGFYQWNHPQYGNNNAGCVEDINVHDNVFNMTVMNMGVTNFSSPCANANNKNFYTIKNNTYSGVKVFGWDGAKRDLNYWNNLGFN